MKLPAFQFYPGDWKRDPGVQSLDYFNRGVWFEILLMMHESEQRGILLLNGTRMPDEALARALGLAVDLVKQILTTLLTYGVASIDTSTGAIMCRRMVRDEKIRKVRSNSGKLGGNPVLLNQNPTTHLNQNPTPSSSSSSSLAGERERHFQECVRPSLKEVLDKAQFIGLAPWKAEDWFNEMQGCGWKDFHNREIADWSAVMTRVKVKWEADGRPSGPPSARNGSAQSRVSPAFQLKALDEELQKHAGNPTGRKHDPATCDPKLIADYKALKQKREALNAQVARG